MITVGDTIEEVSRLQLKQAVLAEVMRYLDQFISTDSHEPKNGIASPIGDFIPQNVIGEVKDDVFASHVEIEMQIQELKGRAIVGGEEKPPSRKVTKKVAKRSPPKRRKRQ